MHERFTIYVDEHCTEGTNLLRYECAVDLCRERNAGRVILNGILIQQRSACTVAEHKAIGRCAVMVGGREVLVVQTSRTAGGDDDGLCTCDHVVAGLHVEENSARYLALFVLDELNSRGKLNDRDAAVDNFVAQGTHDLCTGVVLAGVHSLSGGAAAVGGDHGAVFGLIEHNAELVQPLDGVRSFHNKAAQQFRAGSEVAAAERVEVMLNRGIVLFIGSLNAAFCHHRVRIADAQLCHDHDLRTCVVRLNSCGSTCAAAADDEHVGVVIDLRQIDRVVEQTAVGVQQVTKLLRYLLTLVRADLNGIEAVFSVIRMVRLQKGILFFCGHTSGFHAQAFLSGCLYFFDRGKHFRCKHGYTLLISRSLCCYRAPASR